MSRADQIIADFGEIPINKHLGYRLLRWSETGATITMPLRLEYLQEGSVVQGGILTALADTAAVYALYPWLPEGVRMTGIECKVNFVRAAQLQRGLLTARSRVVHRGRQSGVCESEVSQEGRLVAIGLFTYLFSGGREEP